MSYLLALQWNSFSNLLIWRAKSLSHSAQRAEIINQKSHKARLVTDSHDIRRKKERKVRNLNRHSVKIRLRQSKFPSWRMRQPTLQSETERMGAATRDTAASQPTRAATRAAIREQQHAPTREQQRAATLVATLRLRQSAFPSMRIQRAMEHQEQLATAATRRMRAATLRLRQSAFPSRRIQRAMEHQAQLATAATRRMRAASLRLSRSPFPSMRIHRATRHQDQQQWPPLMRLPPLRMRLP